MSLINVSFQFFFNKKITTVLINHTCCRTISPYLSNDILLRTVVIDYNQYKLPKDKDDIKTTCNVNIRLSDKN